MGDYADLEVGFRRKDNAVPNAYRLNFRFNNVRDVAEQTGKTDPDFTLDLSSLRGIDAQTYAVRLSAAFFTAEIAAEFERFRVAASAHNASLRVRFTIDRAASELHPVRWETLRDPNLPPDQENAQLFAGEKVILSRFLQSQDWLPVRSQAKGNLRALVVIANPATLKEDYGLAPINVQEELNLARAAMAGIIIVPFETGTGIRLVDLATELRKGYDILYLVCHGALDKQTHLKPILYLQNEPAEGSGTQETTVVLGDDFAKMIQDLNQRPRLVVLASCQSGGSGGIGPDGLSALGPLLAAAGVPAVVAMAGNIFMETASAFMSTFFTELMRDGQIDRATSVARGDLVALKASDYWMPVLFLRLRDGQLWYEPRFAGSSQEELKSWTDIYAAVRKKTFIPVLGPELGEELFRGTQEWAANLARRNGFPLGSYESTDLAKVAQFLTVAHNRDSACERVELESTRSLRRSLGRDPIDVDRQAAYDEIAELDEEQDLLEQREELLALAVDRCHADPNNAFQILSTLPASIYLNTSYETLLRDVLAANARNPELISIPWLRGDILPTPKPVTMPTLATPWVYHIFGQFEDRNTMVLTEDNFFDYLIKATRQGLLAPVAGRLLESSLLFLGFRLDDWRFRVLFRMILAYEGSSLLKDYSHVAVQVIPGEQSVADVNRARKYMESYFLENSVAPKISIYWGSATDFLKQLQEKTAARNKSVPGASA